MDYYRKAAAVFILVLTLILPVFLEQSQETAVVDLEILLEESQYLNEFSNDALSKNEDLNNLEKTEAEIMELVRSAVLELGKENNYSSIVIKQPLYKGGIDITLKVAEKIDQNNGAVN